jgi:hypothetical protein
MKSFYVVFTKVTLLCLALFIGCLTATAQYALPDSLFESISHFDPDHARTGNNVLRTNGQYGVTADYRKLVPIEAGQQVSTDVYAYYEKKRSKKLLRILLGGVTGGISGGIAAQTQQSFSQFHQEVPNYRKSFPYIGVGIAIAPNIFKDVLTATPKAAIQYNFYDKDSSFIESATQSVTKEARNQWQLLHLNTSAKRDGFVEIIIINESKKSVWFDDLVITVLFNKQPTTNTDLDTPITNSSGDPSTTNLYKTNIRSFAPPGSFTSYGFEDDNRGFSTSGSVTSRVKQSYTVVPDGINPALYDGAPTSDPTIKNGQSQTGTPRGHAQIISQNRTASANIARVYTIYEGSNPFYDPFTPDIEVETRITFIENIQKNRLTLAVTANSKKFPALEIFVEDIYGTRVFLAIEGAYGGPGDLYVRDKNYSTITADVTIVINSSGVFQSVYRTGSASQIYSISDWNQQFTSQFAGPISD